MFICGRINCLVEMCFNFFVFLNSLLNKMRRDYILKDMNMCLRVEYVRVLNFRNKYEVFLKRIIFKIR